MGYSGKTMKYKITIISLFASGVLTFSFPASALIEQMGLAGISSIAPSGANDAQRNPALLFRAAPGATLFVGGVTNLSADIKSSYETESHTYDTSSATQTDSYIKMTTKDSAVRSIDIPAGITVKGTGSAFSVLISSGDNSLYTKNTYKGSGTATISSIDLTLENSTTETQKNPGVCAGWATSTSPNGTFGISLFASQSVKETKEEFNISDSTGTYNSSSKTKHTIEKSEFGMTFGFNYASKNAEAGLTLSPMTFGSYGESMTFSGTTDDKKTNKKKFVMFKGVNAKLGFAYLMTANFSILSELDYSLPMSHNEDNLSEDSGVIISQKKEHNGILKTGVRMGLRYTVQSFAVMIGGMCMFEEEKIYYKSTTGDDSTYNRSRILAGSSGIQFSPSDSLTFGIAAVYFFYKADAISENYNAKLYGKMNFRQTQIVSAVSYKL